MLQTYDYFLENSFTYFNRTETNSFQLQITLFSVVRFLLNKYFFMSILLNIVVIIICLVHIRMMSENRIFFNLNILLYPISSMQFYPTTIQQSTGIVLLYRLKSSQLHVCASSRELGYTISTS